MRNTKYDHCPRVPEGALTVEMLCAGGGPVMLEIGPGRGMFALQWAEANPEARLIALEIRRKWATLLDERLRARHQGRARCFAEDANTVLPRLGPDGCVDFAAVHFPDPWWKKKHAKRLVVRDDFVHEMTRLLKPGATLLVQTDVEDRATEYFERLVAHPGLVAQGAPYVDESPFAPARSNREARAAIDGLPVYRMVFVKAAG
ncbi:MAG: methyltransferase domain-containing protein [Myxococcales bacterium]|nr:methyltransferase domain-containing protein [Myxococcales bacterium]